MTLTDARAALTDAYQALVYEVERLREQRDRVRAAQRTWREWRNRVRAMTRQES